MPPADNTPDFDSMSPEELMAWMESLAKRQGAQEGFTTSADMEVAEVDPSTVQIDEPGYVPYGMDPEKWKAMQEAEAAEKAAQQAKAAPPVSPIPTAAEAPAPAVEQPAAAMAADVAPDFDSMSPEELMAWMETLAERQGATTGFTSDKRVEIAEVDPSTVQIDEPGYVPYGMDPEKWKAMQEAEAAEKAAQTARTKRVEPAPETAFPQMELPGLEDEEDRETEPASVTTDDAMAWLESLAADTDTGVPQVDLSALSADIEPLIPADMESVTAGESDPLAWLESLAKGEEGDLSALAEEAEEEEVSPPVSAAAPAISDPIESGVDPVEWLESLAKRQGVSSDELVTSADLSIPVPDELTDTGPGYTDYTFESEVEEVEPAPMSVLEDFTRLDEDFDPSELDDPEAWLESLVTAQGFDLDAEEEKEEEQKATVSDADLLEALNQGKNVSVDDMKAWMEKQFDRAETIDEEVEEEVFDPEAPPIKAEIPDWLLEQMGTPPALDEEETASEPEPLESLDELLEPVEDIPDWLEQTGEEGELEAEAAESVMEISDWLKVGEEEEEAPEVETAEPATEMPDWLKTAEEEEEAPEVETAEPAMEMPDWLKVEEPEEEVSSEAPPLVDEVVEPEMELPDWLQVEEPEDYGIEGIFAETDEEKEEEEEIAVAIDAEVPIDISDPWVEAFELERTEGMADIDTIPDWYAERLNEAAQSQAGETLQAATFEPEAELVAGEAEEVPDWFTEASPVEEVEAVPAEMPDWLSDEMVVEEEIAASDDLPDWLREATIEPAEVPDWLMDTLKTDEQPVAEPAPAAVPTTSPVSVPAAAQIDVAATLDSARTKMNSGDIESCLTDYESIVRTNVQLDAVVTDLSRLIEDKKHRENPAIYRVLGDSLMRQGKLQSALDTYRRALNLL